MTTAVHRECAKVETLRCFATPLACTGDLATRDLACVPYAALNVPHYRLVSGLAACIPQHEQNAQTWIVPDRASGVLRKAVQHRTPTGGPKDVPVVESVHGIHEWDALGIWLPMSFWDQDRGRKVAPTATEDVRPRNPCLAEHQSETPSLANVRLALRMHKPTSCTQGSHATKWSSVRRSPDGVLHPKKSALGRRTLSKGP